MSAYTTSDNGVADTAENAGAAHLADTPHTAPAAESGRLVLLRHGETAWSLSGQHTGRTDIPLTEHGGEQAAQAAQRLHREFPHGFDPAHVFVSPLERAQQTAKVAGFEHFNTLPGIAEWDYGRAEGRTIAEIGDAMGRPWDLWSDGPDAIDASLEGDHQETLPSGDTVDVHNGTGETLDQVADRAKGVIDELMPLITAGNDVLLVAHAHIIRILTTQWLGVDPKVARLFRLGTAHYSVLSVYRGDRVIDRWNV